MQYRLIEEFGKKHGTFFSGAGDGIGHQIMIENGFAWPGTVTVASDSVRLLLLLMSCVCILILILDYFSTATCMVESAHL